jgi:hypothetical protein
MSNKKIEIKLVYVIAIIIAIFVIIFIVHKVNNKDSDSTPVNKQEIETASNTKFKVKDVEIGKGEEVAIEIDLLNTSNFVAANFEYQYDKDNLEYVSYEKGETAENAAMLMINNVEDKILIGYVADPQKEKTLKAGNIVSLKFKVKDSAKVEEIKNIFKCTTLKNEDGSDIKYDIEQGNIKIK